jgi:hypothetical protein
MKKVGVGFTAVLVVSLVAWVISYGLSSGWNATQWGPVAAWFSGILTVVAVGVALYQTVMARRDTEIARAEAAEQVATARADAEAQRLYAVEERSLAEARHAQQLQNSEQLLSRQLDAQRRSEQIATLPPIWAAIMALQVPFSNLIDFLKHELPELAAVQDRPAAEKIQRQYESWMKLLGDLELVFVPAEMIVGEEHVYAAVNDLYEDTRQLSGISMALIEQGAKQQDAVDTAELEAVFARIVAQRRVMSRLVREHLSQVQPLTRKFSFSDPNEGQQDHEWQDI